MRELHLESAHLLTEDQPPAFADAVDGTDCVLLNIAPLSREIIALDLERRAMSHWLDPIVDGGYCSSGTIDAGRARK
jgi:hypothetical protein